MTTLAWYWQALLILAWVCVVLGLAAWLFDTRSRQWLPATILALVALGIPAWVVAYSWLDDDAPKSRCENLGGIVVVTPAQGRACIDREAVIPESEWVE